MEKDESLSSTVILKQILEANSFYEVLGLKKGHEFSEDTLRKKYIQLSRKIHPDKMPGNLQATKAFQKLSNAYETLKDPQTRFQYDMYGDCVDADAKITFERLVRQMFEQFQNRDFQSILNLLDKISSEDANINIDKEQIKTLLDHTSKVFTKLDKSYVSFHQGASKASEAFSKFKATSLFDIRSKTVSSLHLLRALLVIPLDVDFSLPHFFKVFLSSFISCIDHILAFPEKIHRLYFILISTDFKSFLPSFSPFSFSRH
eukprot:Sdes_comp19467_c0_seq2m10908